MSQSYKPQEGVVLIKSFLTPQDQVSLWADIEKCAEGHNHTPARNAKSNFLKIISVNRKKKSKIPGLFSDFAERAAIASHRVCPTIPPEYRIDYITSFKYPRDEGKLTGHCDKIAGWVVLFSLGCTANFWVKGKEMQSKFVFPFESGDALMFNGGTEFDVQHGISGIEANTAPDYFKGILDDFRVSIQFRQCDQNDNYPRY